MIGGWPHSWLNMASVARDYSSRYAVRMHNAPALAVDRRKLWSSVGVVGVTLLAAITLAAMVFGSAPGTIDLSGRWTFLLKPGIRLSADEVVECTLKQTAERLVLKCGVSAAHFLEFSRMNPMHREL